LLTLTDVTRSLGGNPALRGVRLAVAEGERIALVGPSGAGKTSLFRVLNLTLRPDGGTYLLAGQDTAALRGAERRAARSRIATIHQQHDLVGRMTALENVLSGRLGRWNAWQALGARLFPRASDVEEAAEVLRRVEMLDRIGDRADRLSGGQQQRVAIARALFQDARVILADEPVASVDPGLQEEIVRLLVETSERDGRTLLVNLHHPHLALRFFPRIVALREGRVAFDRPCGEVDGGLLRDLFGGDPGPIGDAAADSPATGPRVTRPACRPTDVGI